MWILALLYLKYPAAVRRAVGAWLAVMATLALVAAPCRLFLRAAGEAVPYAAPASLDLLALVLAPVVLVALAVLGDRRAVRSPVGVRVL